MYLSCFYFYKMLTRLPFILNIKLRFITEYIRYKTKKSDTCTTLIITLTWCNNSNILVVLIILKSPIMKQICTTTLYLMTVCLYTGLPSYILQTNQVAYDALVYCSFRHKTLKCNLDLSLFEYYVTTSVQITNTIK